MSFLRSVFASLAVPMFFTAAAMAQVGAPGPTVPMFFDTVLTLPSAQPIGSSLSGGIGGVAGQTVQVNVNPTGFLTDNFTAAAGAEINIDGNSFLTLEVGNNFTALGGSEVNLINGDIGVNFRTESNRVDITGGRVDDDFTADIGAEVNIDGGAVADNFQATGASRVTLSNGSIGSFFTASNSAEVDITGGTVGGSFLIETGAVLNVSGGSTGGLTIGDTGVLNLSGGFIGNNSTALAGSEVFITGGTIGSSFEINAGSVVDISDGLISSSAAVSGVLNVSGTGIVFSGLDLLAGGVLNVSGDGEITSYGAFDGSVTNLTGGSIGDNSDAFSGSVVNVDGGIVSNDFTAHTGSQINVSAGGISGQFELEAGADLTVTGGTVAGFVARPGSEVTISGGLVGSGLMVATGGVVDISGGEVFSSLEVLDGGLLNLTGGDAGDALVARAFSILDISGGEVGDDFDAQAGSTVLISGGLIGDNFENSGNVFLRGGEFTGSFETLASGQLNVFGSDFAIDGAPIAGLTPGVVTTITDRDATFTAVLADGTPLEIDLNTIAGAAGDDFFDAAAVLNVTLINLPGDFNADGVVNAADFVVARDLAGASATTLPNDIDGGLIGVAQIDTFAANFGATVTPSPVLAAIAVPEPTGLAILLGSGCLAISRSAAARRCG